MQWSPVVTSKMCLRSLRKFLTMATLTRPLTQTLTHPDPDPEPKSNPEPEHNEGNLIKACLKLSRVSPSQFIKTQANQKQSSGILICLMVLIQKNLEVFCCKLNFWSKPKSFQTKQLKVNYSLSFLKGTALDYFKPYLANEPVCVKVRTQDNHY